MGRSLSGEALVTLTAAYIEWWTPDAVAMYHEVERIGRRLDDPRCTGLGILGRIRCSRFKLDAVPLSLFDEAGALLVEDRCAFADFQRERAAHHLLADRPDLARECAEGALEIHLEFGDDVLGAYALLLLGRVERDTATDRFRLLRAAYEQADRVGAFDVAADVALFLVPALARGQSPGSPLLDEALVIADRIAQHKREHDPFGAAELDIHVAGMLTLSDPDSAASHASRALAYFDTIGNQLGAASARKALARVEARRLQIVWQGSWIRGVRSSAVGLGRVMRHYAAAKRAYRAAGMELAAQRVAIEESLVRTYEIGTPLPPGAVTGLRAGLTRSDRFTDAKLAVLGGLETMHADPAAARRSFELAAELSAAVGMADLESVAQIGIAATSERLGDLGTAGAAVARFVDHAEHLRVSVSRPEVAIDMVSIAEEPYRYALRIAAESGDPVLALRVLERIRTERLASLFASRSRRSPRPDVEDLIDRLTALDPSDVDRRAVLLAQLEAVTNRWFSEMYAPSTLTIDELLGAIPVGDAVLVQDLLPRNGTDRDLVSVWRVPGGEWRVEVRSLSEPAANALDRLGPGRSHRDHVIDDVAPLVDLVPADLGRALSGEALHRLRIVPSGALWAVPYLVIPISTHEARLIVETADVVLTPSLRLLAAGRTRARLNSRGPVLSWLSPELSAQRAELAPFDDHELIESTSPSEFMDVMARRWDLSMAVITAHCNGQPGLAQSVLLAGRPVIAAADLLALAHVPPIVSIAGCHGLDASGAGDEQLGLTTAALCGGADDVLSSHLELATSAATTVALLRIYRRLVEGSAAESAVCSVVREMVREADRARTPLVAWGVLNVVSVRT